MKNARQVLWGIAIAIISIAFILGGLSLSLAEGNMAVAPAAASLTASPTVPSAVQTSTPRPTLLTPASPTPPTSTKKPTLTPKSTSCPPPSGWKSYVVQSGDTLEKLAERYKTTTQALRQANCSLTSSQLMVGARLNVPPVPTSTPVPCGPPHDWVKYIVQHGDTLYHLGQIYGLTVAELQKANCMGQSTLLTTGQTLYVPPGPPLTLPSTPTTFTETPTFPTVPTSLP